MKLTLMVLGLMFCCFTFTADAKADGARSFISPSGSDNRPCTRNQPCRTFDGAMVKTEAGGEVIAFEGTYDPTTISKSITLTSVPGAEVIIKSTTGVNAVSIVAPTGTNIVLRGLKISGTGKTGKGVSLASSTSSLSFAVDSCDISNFATGVEAVVTNSVLMTMHNSVVHNNNTGLLVRSGGTENHGAVVTKSRFERNSWGVISHSQVSVDIKDSIATDNSIGFFVEQGGHMTLFNSMASKNHTGIEVVAGGQLTIGYSTVTGNVTGMKAFGQVRSMVNNMFSMNEIQVESNPNVTPLFIF